MFDNRRTKAEIIASAAIQNDKLVMAYIDINDFRAEIERLRAAIKQAHVALTKSSLTPDERVYDATMALARSFEVEFHSSHQ